LGWNYTKGLLAVPGFFVQLTFHVVDILDDGWVICIGHLKKLIAICRASSVCPDDGLISDPDRVVGKPRRWLPFLDFVVGWP
jgi:hypothetical protein